jgi:hypothetical protein
MNTATHSSTTSIWQISQAILLTGLLAGTLDITAAHIKYFALGRTNPLGILLFVASGLLGKDALAGGIGTALVGLGIHYCIATTWAAVYFVLASRIELLQKNVLASGMVYGCVVWCAMNLLVLPLTSAPALKHTPVGISIEMGILMACIGVPCAWMARRFFVSRQGA